MKRALVCCIVIYGFILIFGFKTAIDPAQFSGQWYSSDDQSIYLFQEGIIYSAKNSVLLPEAEYISGAYIYSSDSVFLFAEGIEGLETEKEVFLIQRGDSSLLCEKQDGSGKIYFARTGN